MENFSINPIQQIKNGIPFDNVITGIDKSTLEIVTYPICLNLAWDIVDCSKCGLLFCKYCINEAIAKSSNSCPVCRNSPFQSTESKTIKKIVSKFKLKCPNFPCTENPEYSEYIKHQEKCKFRKYHCMNDGCNYETIIENIEGMESHKKSCQYRLIACQYCAKAIKEIDSINHLNNECDKIIECSDCHKSMTTSNFMSKHDVISCLRNQIDDSEKSNKNKDEKLENLNNEINKLKKQIEELKKDNAELIENNKSLSNKKRKRAIENK